MPRLSIHTAGCVYSHCDKRNGRRITYGHSLALVVLKFSVTERTAGYSRSVLNAVQVENLGVQFSVWYGIVEFNVPLDTV